MSRLRNFCFTLNNYTEQDETTIDNFAHEGSNYLVYGHEVGESGTPHLQGYCELTTQTSFSTLKKTFPSMHIEKRKGTAEQAADYCKKDNDRIYEYGNISRQGKRTDLDNLLTDLKDGCNMRKVVNKYNYQCIRHAEKYLTYNERVRNWSMEVTWIYGSPGSGKTRMAQEIAGPDAYWASPSSWFDGYDAHETVVFDDYRPHIYPTSLLLRLLDRYPLQVPFKGGFRQFLARKIIVTTPLHPSCYIADSENNQQLMRRITKVVELK